MYRGATMERWDRTAATIVNLGAAFGAKRDFFDVHWFRRRPKRKWTRTPEQEQDDIAAARAACLRYIASKNR